MANVDYLNREIELEAFYPNPKDRMERAFHLLCPVRALRHYLNKTSSVRKDRQLFVSYKSGSEGHKVSKQSISRWIRDTICHSYRHLDRAVPRSSFRAHSTRAAASSLADLRGVSPSDLCKAATWSSACVFAKLYRLNMTKKTGFSSEVLKVACAGRH